MFLLPATHILLAFFMVDKTQIFLKCTSILEHENNTHSLPHERLQNTAWVLQIDWNQIIKCCLFAMYF